MSRDSSSATQIASLDPRRSHTDPGRKPGDIERSARLTARRPEPPPKPRAGPVGAPAGCSSPGETTRPACRYRSRCHRGRAPRSGYSQSVVLAPGDSVTGSDMRVVSSPPGSYTLLVRQLVQPSAWVEVPVVVR